MTGDKLDKILRAVPLREPRRRVFRLGDAVRLRSGPLASLVGRVEGINQAKALLKVKVSLLGRERYLKLSFREVEQADESWRPFVSTRVTAEGFPRLCPADA